MKSLLLTSGIIVAMFLAMAALMYGTVVFGNITEDRPTPEDRVTQYVFFATSTNQTVFATSTTATSTNITQWTDSAGRIDAGYFVIRGAEKVTLALTRGDRLGTGNSGSHTVRIQVTPDGTNWYYFANFVENASSTPGFTALTDTTDGITLTGTSTKMVSLDLSKDSFLGLRLVADETTDGDFSATAAAEF